MTVGWSKGCQGTLTSGIGRWVPLLDRCLVCQMAPCLCQMAPLEGGSIGDRSTRGRMFGLTSQTGSSGNMRVHAPGHRNHGPLWMCARKHAFGGAMDGSRNGHPVLSVTRVRYGSRTHNRIIHFNYHEVRWTIVAQFSYRKKCNKFN